MVQVSRRWLLRAILLGLAGFAAFVARPVYHLGRVAWRDLDRRQPGPQGSLDDASRMSPTPVAKYIEVADETALAAALQEARTMGWGVAIAGARQSMGGQALVRDGMVLDLKAMDVMNYDEDGKVLTVGAGARWGDVVRFLDDKGRSVVIMPPYEDFSVGGSLATNSHGAMTGQAPIAQSVRRLRVMLASGEIVRCDRRTKQELFALVLGGYGLAGVILDAELETVANRAYLTAVDIMTVEALAARLAQPSAVADSMLFARLTTAAEGFLEMAALTTMTPTTATAPRLGGSALPALRRAIFRAGAGNSYGKTLRWRIESRIAPLFAAGQISRNQILLQSALLLENREDDHTDILQGYFIPAKALAAFIQQAGVIIADRSVELLDLELHGVAADDLTMLRYAERDLLALTLRFRLGRLPGDEYRMRHVARALIGAAQRFGGRQQLAYRLHASTRQFNISYPQARRFFKQRRSYDPEGLFRNGLSDAYETE